MNSRILNIILPIIGVIVYICIDFLYVFLNKKRYEDVFVNIQKAPMELDAIAIVICYIVMGIGWYFIAVQLASSYTDKLKQRSPTWTPLASSGLSGLVAGLVYGLVVYGVYNLTTRSVFYSRYPLSILTQDIAWGALFNMVFTSVFMIIWCRISTPVDL